MRIIIDAMGGDHAPEAVIAGAVRAAAEFNTELVLVGRGAELLQALKKQGVATLPKGMEVANAEDVVDMHDDPATVVRKRRDSSMVAGLRMVAEGKGDAFISAGNTGALLTAATLIVKRIHGIRRAVLAPEVPTAAGRCILLDAGANVECTPEFLVQFACMGSIYAKTSLDIPEPRVGLLNVGGEDGKGGPLQTEAFARLTELDQAGVLRFTGNVEARDVPLGGTDVVVCDGFSGNVLLKSMEGTAIFMSQQLKGIFKKNGLTKLGAVLCRSGIREMKERMDYRQVGGTPLLGIQKPVIKAHGSSDEVAFFHAVRQTVHAISSSVCRTIQENIDKISIPKGADKC